MRALGIAPSIFSQRTKTLNKFLQCLYIAEISILFLSTLWFLLFNAERFDEYVESFFYCVHSIFLCAWYSAYYLQREISVSFVAELEAKIKQSTHLRYIISNRFHNFLDVFVGRENLVSHALFKRIDNAFYLTSKNIFDAELKIFLPCYALPTVLLSISEYISSNHSKDSFQQHFAAT